MCSSSRFNFGKNEIVKYILCNEVIVKLLRVNHVSYYLVRMFNWYPYVIAWWQQILTITFMCGRACESICIDHIFVCVWLLKFSRWGASSIYSVYEINVKSLALNRVVWPDTDISLVSVYEDLLLETFYLWVVVVILSPEEYSTTHSICKTFLKSFHKCIPLAVAREHEAHRADNRYLTIIQLEGSRVIWGYLWFPDVSSTLHSQNEWFDISGSDIYS